MISTLAGPASLLWLGGSDDVAEHRGTASVPEDRVQKTKTLSSEIQEHRRIADFTQEELARRAGIGVSTLRDLEQGRVRRPRPDSVRRIAGALGVGYEAFEALPVHPPRMFVEVLGPTRVTCGGVPVDLAPLRLRAILGVLAAHLGRRVGRDTLVDVLWGPVPPPEAVAALHSYISRLRGLLTAGARGGPAREVIAADADGYRLVVSGEEVDLGVFRAGAAKARQLAQAGAVEAAFESFRDALAQWSGEPFLEFPRLRGLPWVDALSAERAAATVECADLALQVGRGGEVVGLLRQAAAADPFHEPLHARLILALDAAGQRAAAVRVYAGVRRRLADELGVPPCAELASAFQQVITAY